VLSSPTVATGFVLAGLLAPLLLGRTRNDRLLGYAAALPVLVVFGTAGYAVSLLLYALLTGV
jgi:hypothetical protein